MSSMPTSTSSTDGFICKFCEVTFISPLQLILHKKRNHMDDLKRICMESKIEPESVEMENKTSLIKSEAIAEIVTEPENDPENDGLTVWVSPHLKLEAAYESDNNDDVDYSCQNRNPNKNNDNDDDDDFTPESETEIDMGMDSETERDPLDINNFETNYFDSNLLPKGEADDSESAFEIYNHNPIPVFSPYQCRFCKIVFRKKSYLADHERIHTGEKPFVCPRCNMSFRWKHSWKRHCSRSKCSSYHRRQKVTTSVLASASTSLLSDLENETKTSAHIYQRQKSSSFRFIPSHSLSLRKPPSFIRANHPHVHRKAVNGSIVNICKFCNKSFSSYCSIKVHVRTHTGEKPYSCTICNQKFAARANMYVHRRRHTGDRPYSCQQCDQRFVDASGLYHHKKADNCTITSKPKVVHSNRPFLVTRIPKVSFRAPIIQRQSHAKNSHIVRKIKTVHPHMTREISVDGSVVNICKFCNKEFDGLDKIKVHLRSHTGEKPYSCSYCDQRFSQTGTLKIHERLHTGERPCKCPHCGEAFISFGAVNYHKKKCINNTPLKKQHKQSTTMTAKIKQRRKPRSETIRNPKASHPHVTRKSINGTIMNFCNFCNKPFERYYDAKRHTYTHNKEKN